MTVYRHRRPGNYLNQALDSGNVVIQNELAVHQGRKVLFTQGQLVVGGLPIVRDSFGGLRGFTRDVYEKTTFLTTAQVQAAVSLTGSTLSANFSTLNILWNGVPQNLINLSASQALSAGDLTSSTWYLSVQRNYGFLLALTNALPENQLSLNLAVITVASSVATTALYIQSSFGNTLFVHETSTPALLIPTSDASGNLSS